MRLNIIERSRILHKGDFCFLLEIFATNCFATIKHIARKDSPTAAPEAIYAALTCNHCGAHLRIDPESPTVTCEYCGATYRTASLLGEQEAAEETAVMGSGLKMNFNNNLER